MEAFLINTCVGFTGICAGFVGILLAAIVGFCIGITLYLFCS